MNKFFLTGNVARDAELKITPSNKKWTRVAIAVNRPFSKDIVDFIDLIAWERDAEFICKWTPKGTRILVEGHIQKSKYKDKDGNERSTYDFVVEKIEFAGGKKDSSPSNDRRTAPAKNDAPDIPDDAGIDPEDTPF